MDVITTDTISRLYEISQLDNQYPDPVGYYGNDAVNTVSFTADSKFLSVGSSFYVGSVWFWRLVDNTLLWHHWSSDQAPVWGIATSPTQSLIAAGGGDAQVQLWDQLGHPVKELVGHKEMVTRVKFSPDGQLLAACVFDDTVWLWQVADSQVLRVLRGTGHFGVAFAPDGKTLITGIPGGGVGIWQVATGLLLRNLVSHEREIWCMALSADGLLLALGYQDSSIEIWQTQQGRLLYSLTDATMPIECLSFNHDGTVLAAGTNEGIGVRLWRVADGLPFGNLPILEKSGVRSIAFSPDGHLLAVGQDNGFVQIWGLEPPLSNV